MDLLRSSPRKRPALSLFSILLTVTHVKMESLVMKHLISKTMTAVPVLALALAVGGCGSSSSDDEMMPMGPTPEQKAQMECEDMGGRYESDGSCTSAEDLIAEAAERAAAAACTAAGGRVESDGSCTPAADVMAEAAREECTAAMGRYNADGSCTSAEELVEEARMACTDDGGRFEDDESCTPASVLATTAAAGTKAMAIGAEGMQTTDAGLGGSARSDTDGTATAGDATDDPYTLTISRDHDGTEIKIVDPGLAGDDDPKFTQAMDLGGGATMHTRTADDDGNMMEVVEVVVVETDIEPPEAVEFAKFETADGMTPQALNANAAGANATGDDAVAFDPGAVLASTDPTQAAVLANMMSPEFAAAVGESVMHTFTREIEDDTTTDVDESRDAAEFAGTYNGAPGTYKCVDAAADCTVTVNGEGELIGASDGWLFTPDKGAMSDQPDYDYLAYGFWLKKTLKKKTDADDETTYNEVETFTMATGIAVSASGDTAAGGIGSVEGTASYEGGARGVYVKNVTDNQGEVVSATSGDFSADVMLNASFAGGDVPANNQLTVGGMITDFVLSGGEANDWAVTLGLADFGGRATDGTAVPGESPATAASATNTFSGVATGDAAAAAGSWSGAFYGAAGSGIDHDNDAATDAINQAPSAVLGEFNANFTDGTTAGAFGATGALDE